jgi:60Kd inner membrane protein
MRVASLRLRLLAALVDAAVVIGGMAALVGLGITGALIYARVRREQAEPDGEEEDEPSDIHRTIRKFGQSPRLNAALRGASAGLAVASRNWRGRGFRAVGLRRVDTHTGGEVSVRSALIGVLFDQARQAATRPLSRSFAKRQQDRMSALGPQQRAVERKYADDLETRQQAMLEFYKAKGVNPCAGCGWQPAVPVVSQLVVAAGSRAGRTVRDRITGTSVIVDR